MVNQSAEGLGLRARDCVWLAGECPTLQSPPFLWLRSSSTIQLLWTWSSSSAWRQPRRTPHCWPSFPRALHACPANCQAMGQEALVDAPCLPLPVLLIVSSGSGRSHRHLSRQTCSWNFELIRAMCPPPGPPQPLTRSHLPLPGRILDEMQAGVSADMTPAELGDKQLVRLHQLLHEVKFPDPSGNHLSPAGGT